MYIISKHPKTINSVGQIFRNAGCAFIGITARPLVTAIPNPVMVNHRCCALDMRSMRCMAPGASMLPP